MSSVVNSSIKYVHDEQGQCLEVIIPFSAWQATMDKIEGLQEKNNILCGLSQACREVKENRIKPSSQCLEDFLDEL
ncbi:hypothetical protein [Desulfonatronovibrio magnus]|uniref:hypothetical protein n=1 Tax=Desulfonatronovibrio magnus TaxID=698827 RepID=UPI0005EB7700|nr:hypothetical protein [Desulfonatronovibrio magnus]